MAAGKMDVDKDKAALGEAANKLKVDEDPENEGEWMRLADLRYRISTPKSSKQKKEEDMKEFLRIVEKFDAIAVYQATCSAAGIKEDAGLVQRMTANRDNRLKEVEGAIETAMELEGDMEVREGLMCKAQILARSAEQAVALKAYDEAMSLPKTTSGQKLDIEFNLMRVGLFWSDIPFLDKHVQAAHVLVDNGGDWERRNRLKVYEATYLLCIRDFKKAASLLLESISTFTAVELYDYPKFVYYTVVCATVALDRKTVRDKVIHAPEILQVIGDDIVLETMMNSLYHCDYRDFFQSLVDVVVDKLSMDRFLAPHSRYFLRQARIGAYTQYLESYHTVSLPSMAETFGVSVAFLDRELSDLVACGRLSCKVDKVGGVIESNRPDTRNALYQQTIKTGDNLLNRIQKLSRVITI
eukprot:CAMPEP_0173433612 /NCGR_PEP_ID=MMETSP1357-20121228/10997_1 /TAXON_ID=77926 /ORGANISM="Hemiselmis rufescens, Strain PCC563" /LENGTH=411 /DNA_ID=CAMNT_0014398335 /DNA_START=42 /DNA_END=1277 /DNA_ORIENTATION=+